MDMVGVRMSAEQIDALDRACASRERWLRRKDPAAVVTRSDLLRLALERYIASKTV